MEVEIRKISKNEMETVTIACYEVREEILDIQRFIRSRNKSLEGMEGSKIVQIPISEIFYVEAVDNHVFVYLEKEVYEIKKKLYEFEEEYHQESFFRCSKQHIINLMKVTDVTPAYNGRFLARLSNKEEIIISRKYVRSLMEKLRGERE